MPDQSDKLLPTEKIKDGNSNQSVDSENGYYFGNLIKHELSKTVQYSSYPENKIKPQS